MNRVLAITAISEAVTGLALLIYPSLVARLLFGAGLAGTALAPARVAGCALLALGLACWPGRNTPNGTIPALRAMLTYSLLVTIYLAYLGGVECLAGILLWPAVAAHAAFTLLLILAWRREPMNPAPAE